MRKNIALVNSFGGQYYVSNARQKCRMRLIIEIIIIISIKLTKIVFSRIPKNYFPWRTVTQYGFTNNIPLPNITLGFCSTGFFFTITLSPPPSLPSFYKTSGMSGIRNRLSDCVLLSLSLHV